MSAFNEMEICNDNSTKEDEEVEDGELVDDDNNVSDIGDDRLILRAKRFGLTETKSKNNMNPKLKKLYHSMGVDSDSRKEALHLYGTDTMKTHDVFAYFSDFSPASIEWLSDKCCNVVWLDEESCAKALENLSIRIKGQLEIEADESDENEETVNLEDIRCTLPPGIWRKGHSHPLAPSLFLRFATCFDKKGTQPQSAPLSGNGVYSRNLFLDEGDEIAKKPKHDTGNPWSDIARQWRNFEARTTAAVPLIDARDLLRNKDVKKQKTLTERLLRNELKTESEPKDNPPTIRKMHADIEEKKILERNKLKSNIRRDRDRPEPDLRDRLGRKRKRDYSDCEEGDSNSKWKDDEIEDVSLRIEIDNSGDYSEEEWEDYKSHRSSDSDEIATRPNTGDLRNKLQKKKSLAVKKHDISAESVLRTRYMKCPRKGSSYSPLRIEIDNDSYNRSDDD